MRTGIRLVVSLALFPIALAVCIAILVAPGLPDVWAAAVAVVATLGVLLGLRLARSHEAPVRAARLAYSTAALLCGVLLLGIPWPPSSATALNTLILSVGLVASIAVASICVRRARWAKALATALAIYGVFMLVNSVRMIALLPVGIEAPAATISRALAILLGCCWVIGRWHLRPVGPRGGAERAQGADRAPSAHSLKRLHSPASWRT